MNEKTCPKCNNKMIRGLLMTPGGVPGTRWREEPRVNMLFNIIWNLPRVIAYKCTSCGFLENYVESVEK